jgi:hypothetical protein
MATVSTSKRTFTLAEIEEAEESQSGFCLACGATRDMCEPDAEKYPCEEKVKCMARTGSSFPVWSVD